MDENPYKSPGTFQDSVQSEIDSTERRWTLARTVAVMAFLAGLPLGWFAVINGADGYPDWPVVLLYAPVYLLTAFLGDGLIYVAAMVLGTGFMCGFYSYFLAAWPFRKSWLMLFFIHAAALNLIVAASLVRH